MADQLAVAKYETTLQQHLGANKARIGRALDGMIEYDRFVQVTMNALRRTPKLSDCSIDSVFEGVVKCAELGLEPNGPLGHAYLLPFKVSGVPTCTLIIGYRGFLHLMFKGGAVQDAEAHVVFDEDIRNGFKMTHTSAGTVIHHPHSWTPEESRGKPLGAYAVIRFVNGGRHVEPMTWAEIMKVKASSPSADSDYSPWKSWLYEMVKKTPLKRGAKWAPTGRDYTLMARALQYDADHDEVVEGSVVKNGNGLPTTMAPQLAGESVARPIEVSSAAPVAVSSSTAEPVAPRSTPPREELKLEPSPPDAPGTPAASDTRTNFDIMMAALYRCETVEQVDAWTERHKGWTGDNRPEMAARVKERLKEIANKGKTRSEAK